MRRKGRDPHSRQAVAAVLRRIDNMSKAELEHWIDKLSRAPEGVYDPWSEENWVPANGSAPSPDPKDTAR